MAKCAPLELAVTTEFIIDVCRDMVGLLVFVVHSQGTESDNAEAEYLSCSCTGTERLRIEGESTERELRENTWAEYLSCICTGTVGRPPAYTYLAEGFFRMAFTRQIWEVVP